MNTEKIFIADDANVYWLSLCKVGEMGEIEGVGRPMVLLDDQSSDQTLGLVDVESSAAMEIFSKDGLGDVLGEYCENISISDFYEITQRSIDHGYAFQLWLGLIGQDFYDFETENDESVTFLASESERQDFESDGTGKGKVGVWCFALEGVPAEYRNGVLAIDGNTYKQPFSENVFELLWGNSEEKVGLIDVGYADEPLSTKTVENCPSCGEESPSGSKFCGSCGSSLEKSGKDTGGAASQMTLQEVIQELKGKYSDHEDFDEMISDLSDDGYIGYWGEKLCGESFGHNVDLGKSLLKIQEEHCESSNDYYSLGEQVCNPDNLGDKDWGKRLFELAEEKAEDSDDFNSIAGLVSRDDMLSDVEWAKSLYQKAERSAQTTWDYQSIAEAIMGSPLEDRDWVERLYAEAEKAAESFSDYETLAGSILEHLSDAERAKALYKQAETLAEGTWDFRSLADTVVGGDLSDTDWARSLYEKALDAAEDASDLSGVASSLVCDLKDEDWARRVYRKAYEACKDDDEREDVTSSIQDALGDDSFIHEAEEQEADGVDYSASDTCPSCGEESPSGSKFCGSCGQKLALECPSCGAPYERGVKFCAQCGGALTQKDAVQEQEVLSDEVTVDSAEEEFSIQSLPRYLSSHKRVFLQNDLPAKKIKNAKTTFLENYDVDDVLLLVDNTVMGSGKDGLAITKTHIIEKELFEDPTSWRLEDVQSIEAVKTKIYINDDLFTDLQMLEKDAVASICDALLEALQARR